MDMKELKSIAIELMDALKSRGLGEVSIEQDTVKISVKASETQAVIAAAPAMPTVQTAQAVGEAPAAPEKVQEIICGTPVEAPLVGIFYSSPAPDAEPFVLVGSEVKKGDTLFIIEAMKTMNEIKAPCDGTVSRILVEAGDMVEFKQVLMYIE